MAKKTTVVAVTVIHRTTKDGVRGDPAKGIAPVKPEVQVINPGTIFGVTDAEYEELTGLGAIRLPDKDEKVSVDIASIPIADEEEPAKSAKAKSTGKRGGGRKAASKETDTGGDGSDLV